MTPEELEKIEARLKAATPGPWRFESHPPAMILAANDPGCVGTFPMNHGRFTTLRDADADFIAHAPTDIAALLSEVRRLTPAPRIAVWEAGVDDYEGNTVLRDPATGAVLGWFNRADWGGSIWRHDGFANRKSLADLATKNGWEVRDGE